MLELPSLIEWLSAVWGAIVGASGGVAGILGWRWLGRRKPAGESSATAVELSVVRAVAGPGAHELGTILADRVKFWRLTNLIRISEKVDRIRKEKKLRPTDIRPLTFAVGLPLLEHAANVEEDELQEIWANLMVSALTDFGSPEDHGDDLYRTWANTLAEMSSWDCRLLGTVIEEGNSREQR